MNKSFYSWWVSLLLIGTGLFWANYFGIVQTIWAKDVTYITSVIMAIFTVKVLAIGYYTFKLSDTTLIDRQKLVEHIEDNWFVSEQLMALGMFGTVLGLIHMLSVNFAGLVDANNSIDTMGLMFNGLGIALYTNAVGLATSIILKFMTKYLFRDIIKDM